MENICRYVAIGLLCLFDAGSAVECDHHGELIPNTEHCQKYFKCNHGEPTIQDCPGNLIFDPGLLICNWPESTTCIKYLQKSEQIQTKLEAKESDLTLLSENLFSDFVPTDPPYPLLPTVPTVPTVPTFPTVPTAPTVRTTEPVPTVPTAAPRHKTNDKISERIRNLFNSRNRKLNPTNLRKKVSSVKSYSVTTYRPKLLLDKDLTLLRVHPTNTNDNSDHRNDEAVTAATIINKYEDEDSFITLKPILPYSKIDRHKQISTEDAKIFESQPHIDDYEYNYTEDNFVSIAPSPILEYSSIERNKQSLEKKSYLENTQFSSFDLTTTSESIKDQDLIDAKKDAQREDSNYVDIDPLFDEKSASSKDPIPTMKEISLQEEFLTKQHPKLLQLKENLETLDASLVDTIEPGNLNNPPNVKRVEFILSEDNYNELFPLRHRSYTYKRLLQDTKPDQADPDYPAWLQGLKNIRESNCTDETPGCEYNQNCGQDNSLDKKWSCGRDRAGKWMKYFGRGAIQLKYSRTYGQFSEALFGDGRLLLDYPDFVADTWLNFASATWFYVTPQAYQPSLVQVIDGTWVPNSEDRLNGLTTGFGATINLMTGGDECGDIEGIETQEASNRISYYKQFAWYLYVDYKEEELGCSGQKNFPRGGAASLPLFWDKDLTTPYSCNLVTYKTAHSAIVKGDYLQCVEEHFKVKISRTFFQVLEDFIY